MLVYFYPPFPKKVYSQKAKTDKNTRSILLWIFSKSSREAKKRLSLLKKSLDFHWLSCYVFPSVAHPGSSQVDKSFNELPRPPPQELLG